MGDSRVAHDDDFRKHRQYGLQCAAAMPIAAQSLRDCVQAILRDNLGRIACASSWEATAFAGALSIEVRKKTSALTFEHYPSLVDPVDAGQTFGARLSEFCRRTTNRAGIQDRGHLGWLRMLRAPGVGELGQAHILLVLVGRTALAMKRTLS